MKCHQYFLISLLVLILFLVGSKAWFGGGEKVLLSEVSAITLYDGRKTTGRRSSPVPQLKCIGGSANSASKPSVVQCKNVGSDGFDVQWECKADLDDSYRFGKLQVTCEGYDHPNDVYVLKGSCGLEYTLEYTESGKSRQNQGGYNGYNQQHNNNYPSKHSSDSSSWFIFFIIILAIGILLCKVSQSNTEDTNVPPRHSNFRDSHSSNTNSPPPYGFKREHTSHTTASAPPPSYDDATGDTYTRQRYSSRTHTQADPTPNNTGGGGFWSGLGVGSLAGYLFGSRNNNQYGGYNNYGWGNNGYNSRRGWGWGNRGSTWGSGGSTWGSGSNSWGSGSSSWGSNSSNTSRSSGTSRTASGFGGTSRR
ncbi:store-operated calcium entry-associated regulatory factor-like [Ciona intestinalis]